MCRKAEEILIAAAVNAQITQRDPRVRPKKRRLGNRVIHFKAIRGDQRLDAREVDRLVRRCRDRPVRDIAGDAGISSTYQIDRQNVSGRDARVTVDRRAAVDIDDRSSARSNIKEVVAGTTVDR